MNSELVLILVIAVIAIVAGVIIIVMGLRQRSMHLELMHRERMAMIERGMAPPPEMVAADRVLPQQSSEMYGSVRSVASRAQLTFGIVLIGAGLAFMTVIGIAADSPAVALGLGGAIVIFGMALIVISQVNRQYHPNVTATNIRVPRPPSPPPPPAPPDA